MRRKLFNLATAVSLLMCVGAAALWARSRWRSDSVSLQEDPSSEFVRQFILNSQPSGLKFQSVWETPGPAATPAVGGNAPAEGWVVDLYTYESPEQWMWGDESRANRWGFWYSHSLLNRPQRCDRIIRVGVPHWVAVAGFGALPACWWVRRRRLAGRRRRGLCDRCGYDLRGHTGGDRCPECGTVFPAAVAVPPPA
jgi:hypothetical protein